MNRGTGRSSPAGSGPIALADMTAWYSAAAPRALSVNAPGQQARARLRPVANDDEQGQAPSVLAAAAGALGHMIESFWGRMQTELFNRRKWRPRLELANAIFEYLEISHNRRRRHSALGMLTPIEYELTQTIAEPVV
jgi:transposase InsO family protein